MFLKKGIAVSATLKQGNQVLNLLSQHNVDSVSLQELLGSGLLSDLFQADVALVDREQFRELLGLAPTLSADEERRRKASPDPLERYLWLNRKFCFTGMDLTIHDQVIAPFGVSHVTHEAKKNLKVFPLKVSSQEQLRDRAIELIFTHNMNRCEVLDRRGRMIGKIERTGINDGWYTPEWDFDLDQAKFLTLEAGFDVIVYEITVGA